MCAIKGPKGLSDIRVIKIFSFIKSARISEVYAQLLHSTSDS